MNRQETAGLIAVLCAAFPQVTVSRETMRVYHEVLHDLDHEQTKQAVREILLTAEWFPPPAVIRRKVAERAGLLAPSPSDAWAEVMAQVRLHGTRGNPVFSHPAIDTTVKALGWWNICMSEMPDTIRAHFLKGYEAHRQAMDTRVITDCLTGIPARPTPALGVSS